jgi:hypothetical protein
MDSHLVAVRHGDLPSVRVVHPSEAPRSRTKWCFLGSRFDFLISFLCWRRLARAVVWLLGGSPRAASAGSFRSRKCSSDGHPIGVGKTKSPGMDANGTFQLQCCYWFRNQPHSTNNAMVLELKREIGHVNKTCGCRDCSYFL